jgi:hypothetical protein
MDNETIHKLWTEYVDFFCNYVPTGGWGSSPLFDKPSCATCTHWHIFQEETMEVISKYAPEVYEHICQGMKGKSTPYKEDGKVVDSYNEYIFYGYCKRFPPTLPESDSITKKGIFSSKNIKTPRLLPGYIFPVLPQEEVCGEWKQSSRVKDLLAVISKVRQSR